MQIDWDKIQEKYPNSYLRFTNEPDIDVLIMKEDICYCRLEKFFDDNGIIITISYYDNSKLLKGTFAYCVEYIKNNEMVYYTYVPTIEKWLNRSESKLEAIYKAFEIMETNKC